MSHAAQHRFAVLSLALALAGSCAAQAHAADVPVFLMQWGTPGVGDGHFDRIAGIATDPLGYVYVADSNQWLIQKFRPDSAFVTQWNTPLLGGELGNRPVGLASDRTGHVYMTEYFTHQLYRYTDTGELEVILSGPGTAPGQLHRPTDVEVEQYGTVLVVDSDNTASSASPRTASWSA